MTDKEKIVSYETHFGLDKKDKPIELCKKPLTQRDLEAKPIYWKMKYVEANRRYLESQRDLEACLGENRILKGQVENLKELLKELPSLRRDKKDLTDLSVKHEAEIELLKSEVNRFKQKNVRVLKSRNPQQRDLNGVYKSRRILETKNKNLQKDLEDIKVDCRSLAVKNLENTRILENMPRKIEFKRLVSNDDFDMYEGVYELVGFGTYENDVRTGLKMLKTGPYRPNLAALSPIWRKSESDDLEIGCNSLCFRIFYNIQTKRWELHEGDSEYTTTHLTCLTGELNFRHEPSFDCWISSIFNTNTIYKIEDL